MSAYEIYNFNIWSYRYSIGINSNISNTQNATASFPRVVALCDTN